MINAGTMPPLVVERGTIHNLTPEGDIVKSMIRLLLSAAIFCLLSPTAKAQNKGATLFQSNCQMCHGADGKGSTPTGQALKVVNLHSPEIIKMNDTELANVISNGKKNMPAFGSQLTPAQIENLVSYIRMLQKR